MLTRLTIPRLAADANSPHYFGLALLDAGFEPHSLVVRLSGVERTTVVEADQAEGWADVLAVDESGVFRIDIHGDAVIVREHGPVEFWAHPLGECQPYRVPLS